MEDGKLKLKSKVVENKFEDKFIYQVSKIK